MPAIAEWVMSGGVLAGVGYTCVRSLAAGGRRGRLRAIALRRAPRARRAATEAALDDPAFAPERIEAAVEAILPRLLGEARAAGRPRVDILSVVNRDGDVEDRVVVRVRAEFDRGPHDPVVPRRGRLDQRWTLVHRGSDWRLAATSGEPLSATVLSSPLIASAQDDTERLREASLQELTSRAGPGGPSPAELIDPEAPPSRQLTGLAVADDRFDPLLIEASLTHVVEAWEQSGEGSDVPLLSVATGAGAHGLTFPGADRGRRRVHDAHLQRWAATRVDASARPPRVEVRVRVKAEVEESGSDPSRARRLDLVWTLELDETTHAHPRWRLAGSADGS